MKARIAGKKRRAAGWTLLTLGVIVAGVWAASRWWWLDFSVGRVNLQALWGTGRVTSAQSDSFLGNPRASLTLLEPDDRTLKMSYGWWSAPAPNWRGPTMYTATWGNGRWLLFIDDLKSPNEIHVVLWPIPPLLCAAAALLLRSGILARRRALAGQCRKCGYSRTGLSEGAPCPECGKGAATT